MNLTIDIGNTRIKYAVFEDDKIVHSALLASISDQELARIKHEFPGIGHCLACTTKPDQNEREKLLKKHFENFAILDHQTPLPIINNYQTPETLGMDRLAGAIGARSAKPGHPVLLIDAGTAITYDLVNQQDEYEGGAISPGLETRFRALNQFTGKLPMVQKSGENVLVGNTTRNSILAGVQNGICFEMEGFIDQLSNKYPGLVVFLSGGDADFFAKKIKNTIFVDEFLTFKGLNEIIRYNGKK